MAIGIRLRKDTSGLQQKCLSADFSRLLELRLIETHTDGCFQSVCRIFAKYLGKTNVMESF